MKKYKTVNVHVDFGPLNNLFVCHFDASFLQAEVLVIF